MARKKRVAVEESPHAEQDRFADRGEYEAFLKSKRPHKK